MKKAFVLFVALLCALTVMMAAAEDLSALTLEELTARRQELIDELTQVNALRGSMIRQQELDGEASEESLGKIIDLFPDEEFAKVIRDECAKFSVEQTVTKKDLEKIKYPSLYSADISDLTGIGLLTELRSLSLGMSYKGSFPSELRNCHKIESIEIEFNKNVTEIPDWIGELTSLRALNFYGDDISLLPDSICDLINLEMLIVSYNKNLVALPERIGNCVKLEELGIASTSISSLPDSIWNLQLSTLDMSGTSIR